MLYWLLKIAPALYHEYIDRPKLPEQKTSFEDIAPPPLKWLGTKKFSQAAFGLFHLLIVFHTELSPVIVEFLSSKIW